MVLKSQAHVVGDIRHQSLTIEKGAYFDGRATQVLGANGRENPKELPEGVFERPARLMLGLSKSITKADQPSPSDDHQRPPMTPLF